MIEHIKSAILFMLVGFSLILTFALWTYQPEFQDLDTQGYIEETKLSGQEKTIKDIVYPSQIVFHNYHQHKMFKDKVRENRLYNDLLSWDITSISMPLTINSVQRHLEWSNSIGWSTNTGYRSIEINYPIDVPIGLINQMFKINENEVIDDFTFNKVYLNLDNNKQQIQVVFVSDHVEEQSSEIETAPQILTGQIESSSAYQELIEILDANNSMVNLDQYTLENNRRVYLPEEEISLRSYAVITEELDPTPMRNVLFKNPSSARLVTTNDSNSYYTDGSRRLVTQSVFGNDEVMEFVNSLYENSPLMNAKEMIQKSVEYTNDHAGWTDDFKLDQIDDEDFGLLNYRMYYNGYPIFDINQRYDSISPFQMQQKWRNNQLYSLRRPLFKIRNNPSIEGEELASGESVYQSIQAISEQLSYIIQDVRIGYKLNTRSDGRVEFELTPEWHVKVGNSWRPLSHLNDVLTNQGVE